MFYAGCGSASYSYDPSGNRVGAEESFGLNQNISSSYAMYDGYGELLGGSPLDPIYPAYGPLDIIGYKGQFGCVTDLATDLIYCQNRYYSPVFGRWLTRDPTGLDGGLNVYEYCGNNPLMGADPSGLQFGTLEALWVKRLLNYQSLLDLDFPGENLDVGLSADGWDAIDLIGDRVNVGGTLTGSSLTQDDVAMTVNHTVHIPNWDTWNEFKYNLWWQYHEHMHTIQAKLWYGDSAPQFLAAILSEYADYGGHDLAPMEIEANNYGFDKTYQAEKMKLITVSGPSVYKRVNGRRLHVPSVSYYYRLGGRWRVPGGWEYGH